MKLMIKFNKTANLQIYINFINLYYFILIIINL